MDMDILGLLEDIHAHTRVIRCGKVVIGYDIDLVSGRRREVYEGRGIGLIASTW